MQLRILTLCDGAYNYDGKLTIVGTIDQLKSPKFPTTLSIGIATKIAFEARDNGERKISLRITDMEGSDLISPIISNVTIDVKDDERRIVLAGNIQGLNIPQEGKYKVIVTVNNTDFELPFKAIKS